MQQKFADTGQHGGDQTYVSEQDHLIAHVHAASSILASFVLVIRPDFLLHQW